MVMLYITKIPMHTVRVTMLPFNQAAAHKLEIDK